MEISSEGEIMEKTHFQDGITLVIGILLALIPFVVANAPPDGRSTMLVTANFLLSGAAAVVLGVTAMFVFRIWEEWLDIALGAWLIASPWVLVFTYAQETMWSAITSGVVIAVMGIWITLEITGKYAASAARSMFGESRRNCTLALRSIW
jgi:hypothetical protein